MKKRILYFVDEDEVERRSAYDNLVELFTGADVEVQALEPLASLPEYAELVALETTAGFILDQRLNTTGKVAYTGIELAQALRGFSDKVPIVILTNYGDDDFGKLTWAIEYIADKARVLNDPAAREAEEFKQRILRHVNVFREIEDSRAIRFHELLLKSLGGSLTGDEVGELQQLNAARLSAVAGAELNKQQHLDAEIANLKKLLEGGAL